MPGDRGHQFRSDRPSESYSNFNALPGIAFAYTGLYRSTVYGGYHRGMSTGVLRNEDFPAPDEIGDNFNLGFRQSAIKGFDLRGRRLLPADPGLPVRRVVLRRRRPVIRSRQ